MRRTLEELLRGGKEVPFGKIWRATANLIPPERAFRSIPYTVREKIARLHGMEAAVRTGRLKSIRQTLHDMGAVKVDQEKPTRYRLDRPAHLQWNGKPPPSGKWKEDGG